VIAKSILHNQFRAYNQLARHGNNKGDAMSNTKIVSFEINLAASTTMARDPRERTTANYTFRLRNYHAATLNKLLGGLAAVGARLEDGRLVDSRTTTIMFMLEQAEKEIAKSKK
jgi:hypothetical protein